MISTLTLFLQFIFAGKKDNRKQGYKHIEKMHYYELFGEVFYPNNCADGIFRYNHCVNLHESVETLYKTCFLSMFAFPEEHEMNQNKILGYIANPENKPIFSNFKLSAQNCRLHKFCSTPVLILSCSRHRKPAIGIYIHF